ncbi:MAG TPA: hypothetical protein VFW87_05480, partial [Pirellulales bacterium]|nr:hypothetical protein [Pirellulales bacterium]
GMRRASFSEMAILRRVINPDEPYLSREAARDILRFEFSKVDQRRMNHLAAKNRRGQITAEEEQELDNFVRVGQTIGILKSKARQTLQNKPRPNGKKPQRP